MRRCWIVVTLVLAVANSAIAADAPATKRRTASAKKKAVPAVADQKTKADKTEPAEAQPAEAKPAGAKPKPAAGGNEVRAAFLAGFQFFAGKGAVPVDPQAEANAEAQLRAQFAPQMQGVVAAELRFLKSVCQPTADQSKQLTQAAKEGGELAIKKLATHQAQMQRGVRTGTSPNPSTIVSEVLAKAVADQLSTEQAAAYENQLRARSAARREAALKMLVADIDQELLLTAEQREKIRESLVEHWDNAWTNQLEYFSYGSDYIPNVPDGLVVNDLTEWQKDIWKQRSRPQHTIWGWQGMMFGNMIGLPAEAVDGVEFDFAAPAEAGF